MKGWIIAIVCTIVLGVLLEIVLPKGKMAKYVKGVFSLVVILVIVSPLPKLFGSDWKFDFSSAWANVNNTFVDETKDDRLDEQASELESYLALYGYDCEIKLTTGEKLFEIGECEVTSFGKSEDAEAIIDLVANKLGIDRKNVRFILKPHKYEEQ